MQVIKNVFVKAILWVSLLILLLFFTTTSFLRLPAVQTKIVQRLTTQLDSLTGFSFQIDYVNLNWFDEVKLEGLQVKDTKDSIMIFVPAASINFNISLRKSRKPEVKRILKKN